MPRQKKKSSKSAFGRTLITPVGRLVFPSLAKATAFQEGQEKKFSAMLVCSPSEKLAEVEKEVAAVGRKFFGDAWDTNPGMYRPHMEGDEIISKIDEPSDSVMALYGGRVRLIAKGSEDKEAPKCYLADKSQLPRRPGNEEDLKVIEQTFYPGCFVRLAITPFTFVTGKNSGVGLILKGVQFYKDGERLGGVNLDDAFSEEFSDMGDWEEESAFDESADVEESTDSLNLG